MGVFHTYRYIATHPMTADRKLSAFGRWLRWQLGSRLLRWPVVVPFVGNTRLLVRAGMTGATGNIYCGLHEFEDMAFALHFLRPGDLFVDIGANVGAYTVLASAVVGARSIALEPVRAPFRVLQDNIRLNGIDQLVEAHNVAVGRETGEIAFTLGHDTGNHVVAAGELTQDAGVARVPIVTLPELLGNRVPRLVKMDVEGFETEVVGGGQAVFSNHAVGAVVMELNGSGHRYGFDETALHEQMQGFGFTPCAYDPLSRGLTAMERGPVGWGNILYIRDVERARKRVADAAKFEILGRRI